MVTARKLTDKICDSKGIAAVFVTLSLFCLIGMMALAVDVGHLYVVRGELQNAADASAMAGAAALYRDPASPGSLQPLDFNRARQAATDFIHANHTNVGSSFQTPLAEGSIETGCVDLTKASPSFTSQTAPPCAASTVPGVRAKISRAGGANGGPVPTFFARVFGVDETPVESKPAVAVSGYTGGARPFPIALSNCFTDKYFSQSPLPAASPLFRTNTPYGPGGSACTTAQWTSLTSPDSLNAASTIKDYVDNPKTIPLVMAGENIYIQTGVSNTVYHQSHAGRYEGEYVLVPIVSGNVGDILHTVTSVVGYAIIHIEKVVQSGGAYIEFRFINYSTTFPGTVPGGTPLTNAVTPPLLVQ